MSLFDDPLTEARQGRRASLKFNGASPCLASIATAPLVSVVPQDRTCIFAGVGNSSKFMRDIDVAAERSFSQFR